MDRLLESDVDDPQPGGASPLGVKAEHRRGIRQKTLWLACILAAIFCVWRMAVFVPQPLDSSGTLRPVFYALFSRFIRHYASPEQAFFAWYTFGLMALLIPPALVALNYGMRHAERGWILKWLCSRTLLFASIAFAVVICRYPTLLEPEFNSDEGQFLASADKLFYDGNFFRADDCGTSGPINIYPLMLPAVFGISPDYASCRVIVLAIVLLSIWLFYRTILLLAPDDIARIAIVPVAGIFAVFKNVGLVEYSSEYVPMLFASIGLYATVRVLRSPANFRVPIFLLGFLSSAAFFAKLQAVPILAALAAVAIAYVYVTRNANKRWLPGLLFIAGVAPLPVLNAVLCVATGVWGDFWMSYIVTNVYYADVQSRFVTDMPQSLKYLGEYDEVRVFLFTFLGLGAAYAFQRLRREAAERVSVAFLQSAAVSAIAISAVTFLYLSNFSPISTFLALLTIAVTPIYFLLRWHERPFGNDPVRWFGLLAVLFTMAAMFAVYEAHRPFPHYLLFLFIPFCTAIAWMLIRQADHGPVPEREHSFSIAFVALVVVLSVVCQTYVWGTQDDHVFRTVQQTIRAPEGDFIRSMTSPDGEIEVWGWNVAPYLGSGRVPATHDTNMTNFFRWPEISAYCRKRFLHDMQDDPPEMFIDAIGPASWFLTDRKAFNFQQFPEIESFISTHYIRVADLYGQRYYLRRDVAARKPGSSIIP